MSQVIDCFICIVVSSAPSLISILLFICVRHILYFTSSTLFIYCAINCKRSFLLSVHNRYPLLISNVIVCSEDIFIYCLQKRV